MELKLEQLALPEVPSFNFEELKNELVEKTEYYKTLVYTAEQIKDAKKDRSALNALAKSLNDARLRVQREYMAPFETFKAQVDELIALCKEPSNLIDTQIKDFEEAQKSEKEAGIRKWWDEHKEALDAPEWLNIDAFWDARWLNASSKGKDVVAAIKTRVVDVNNSLLTLSKMPFAFEATEAYKRTLDLGQAIAEGERMAAVAKAKEEAEKAKAEAEQMVQNAPQPVEDAQEAPSMPEPEETPTEEQALVKSEDGRVWAWIAVKVTRESFRKLGVFCVQNKIGMKKVPIPQWWKPEEEA